MVRLPRVKLQEICDGNPWEIDFASSLRKVRVCEGSSYRETTVILQHKTNGTLSLMVLELLQWLLPFYGTPYL